MSRTLLAAAALSLVVTGCSTSASSPDDDPTAAESIGVDPGQPPERGELPTSGPVSFDTSGPDNAGLTLGVAHQAGAVTTKVIDVTSGLPRPPGPEFRPPKGLRWAGMSVSTCFETELDRQQEIGSYLFSAISEDGLRYPAIQPPTTGWPLPQYPGYGRLSPGQCAAGWVAASVPTGATMIGVVLTRTDGDFVAYWDAPAF